MGLVAINTVEIMPAPGARAVLQLRLDALLETLNGTSGCKRYTLACRDTADGPWIITGYWDSVERMTAHFQLPCLAELFELATQRLLSRIGCSTFLITPA
ncbi:MAG: antibiotic biosynthesis monooxygenase [Paucimonas sp.]|jgi:quinol monooxygenase YgiN|nr:antibiotic biosynthesis monooxygenase [Paucimonas sp.]